VNNREKNQSRREERQKQIYRGALKLFRKKGFHATSMREIAKASNVGLGNIYNYFKSKEDILFLVHSNILGRLHQCFDESSKTYEDPVDQMVHVIRSIFELTCQFKDEMLFVYTETKSLEGEYLHEILRQEAQFIADFQAMIERGVKLGVFDCRHPDLAANIIVFNLSISPLRGWNMFPYHDAATMLEALTNFILRGLGVKREVPAPSLRSPLSSGSS